MSMLDGRIDEVVRLSTHVHSPCGDREKVVGLWTARIAELPILLSVLSGTDVGIVLRAER